MSQPFHFGLTGGAVGQQAQKVIRIPRSALAVLLAIADMSMAQSPATEPITRVVPPPAPTPPTRTAPKLIPDTCQRPVYPNAAMRDGLQGTTRVRFDVDAMNRVVGRLVVKSAGHDSLDAATLAAFQTCQFIAGTYNGSPVLSSQTLDAVWRLEGLPPPASAPAQ